MRREKGVNKSHTGLHLLLENSKQKQAFSSRTKGSILPGCSFSILLFSLQSGGKRGSRHLSSSLQCGSSSKLGCFSLGVPNFWGCVAEVTPSTEGEPATGMESFKGGQQCLIYYLQSFQTAPLCFSITLAISGVSEEPSQPHWNAGVFHEPFLQHTFLTWRSHHSAPAGNSLQAPQPPRTMEIQRPQEAPEPFL